jgi:hypothetical protein
MPATIRKAPHATLEFVYFARCARGKAHLIRKRSRSQRTSITAHRKLEAYGLSFHGRDPVHLSTRSRLEGMLLIDD